MTMNHRQSIIKTIHERRSVRTFSNQELSKEIREELQSFLASLDNPFGSTIHYSLFDLSDAPDPKKLGTYGVIKGAKTYLGAALLPTPSGFFALGYEFEKIVLYLTDRGLGSCWLGGTFNRGEFAKLMDIKEGEIFPIMSPIGYAHDKKSLTDNLVRFIAKGDSRKAWNELFFHQTFSNPLTQERADAHVEILESVRLAPSASNKQPWRILKTESGYHFYEAPTPGYSKAFPYDIQRIDMGIAACHFELAAKELGISLTLTQIESPDLKLSERPLPEGYLYCFSFI